MKAKLIIGKSYKLKNKKIIEKLIPANNKILNFEGDSVVLFKLHNDSLCDLSAGRDKKGWLTIFRNIDVGVLNTKDIEISENIETLINKFKNFNTLRFSVHGPGGGGSYNINVSEMRIDPAMVNGVINNIAIYHHKMMNNRTLSLSEVSKLITDKKIQYRFAVSNFLTIVENYKLI